MPGLRTHARDDVVRVDSARHLCRLVQVEDLDVTNGTSQILTL
jgi:hypothetical protein